MENVVYRLYEWGSEDYKKALVLRAGVMALPGGITDWSTDLVYGDRSDEKNHFLLGAFIGGALVGSANLEILPGNRLLLRQLAVHPQMRGQGVGRCLMELADRTARGGGYCEIELHARPSVIAMYEKFGYKATGEQYVGEYLTLTRMIKALN